jgi:hypothetical protein
MLTCTWRMTMNNVADVIALAFIFLGAVSVGSAIYRRFGIFLEIVVGRIATIRLIKKTKKTDFLKFKLVLNLRHRHG